MKTIQAFSLILMAVVFFGCSNSYTVHVVDENAQKMYVIYDKGANVKIGDVFATYNTVVHHYSGGGHDHGGGPSSHSERVLDATVKINRIIDEETAEVTVISGKVENGTTVEKLQKAQRYQSKRFQ